MFVYLSIFNGCMWKVKGYFSTWFRTESNWKSLATENYHMPFDSYQLLMTYWHIDCLLIQFRNIDDYTLHSASYGRCKQFHCTRCKKMRWFYFIRVDPPFKAIILTNFPANHHTQTVKHMKKISICSKGVIGSDRHFGYIYTHDLDNC